LAKEEEISSTEEGGKKRENCKRKIEIRFAWEINDAGHVRKLQDLADDGVGFVDDKVILSR